MAFVDERPLVWQSFDMVADLAGAGQFVVGNLSPDKYILAKCRLSKEVNPVDGRNPVANYAYGNNVQSRFGSAIGDIISLPLNADVDWNLMIAGGVALNLNMTQGEPGEAYRLAIAIIIDPIYLRSGPQDGQHPASGRSC